jgi:hypothetical protein
MVAALVKQNVLLSTLSLSTFYQPYHINILPEVRFNLNIPSVSKNKYKKHQTVFHTQTQTVLRYDHGQVHVTFPLTAFQVTEDFR